ncbi:InlB B-repeat-containing protein [Aeromicrobium fastidiosum]|uniref:InlB B-repeat-containing protein n=1 Tax=Aeromicrobium fastidiosum TaxID=52699 RepID=A0A641AR65_9ACTN|nr:InlB B-repeat-containing protein [Aeromicrobium fastidiosum]KAA1380445.1 InlB B-repeat-containing protein [Aeromicrobium fastidiosum]MBP2390026.1 hypothetical protein [Aeromicrobium fastidiosum]
MTLRPAALLCALTVAVAATTVGLAPPAAAATGIGDVETLVSTASSCDEPTSIELTKDVSAPALRLDVACTFTIDLEGHTLALGNVNALADRTTLTIDDSSAAKTGTLAVDASDMPDDESYAGLWIRDSSRLVVNGGTVTAEARTGPGVGDEDGGATVVVTGGSLDATGVDGAGVGGGALGSGSGGTTTITGGTVVATSTSDQVGAGSAGIGAGALGSGATITIGGTAEVTATGSVYGPGIGGGYQGSGSTISIGGTADVTATAGRGGAGVGGSQDGQAATVSITSGAVTATGTAGGAGIGAGTRGVAGSVVTVAGGTVVASAAPGASPEVGGDIGGAGIGSGFGSGAGTIAISGGSVTATGALHSAGIGGSSSTGGTITIGDAATVEAAGGAGGAGIGGGAVSGQAEPDVTVGAGGTVTIGTGAGSAGPTVTATGGFGAAGIGGGQDSNGAAVTIARGADVTASGGEGASVVGRGAGVSTSTFGSLQLAGTLHVPAEQTLEVPAGATATIANTGVITDAGDDEPSDDEAGGRIIGPGTIANGGVILLPTEQVLAVPAATVTGRHHQVSFDTAGGTTVAAVRVFAPSFVQGGRTFPADPVLAGRTFLGWNTEADGSGNPFSSTSVLAGSSTGAPVEVTAYAQWSPVVPPVDPPVDPPVTPPAANAPVIALQPSITGTAREGRTLTAAANASIGATLTYQWLADGVPIARATASTLPLGKAQAARRISVQVTASAPGSATVVKTSPRTRLVASSGKRLVVSSSRIRRGTSFRVAASGLRPGQVVRVVLDGRTAWKGRADRAGTVSRTVRFATSVRTGSRRVKVVGSNARGRQTYAISTRVRLVR